jgi:hypothetical protein
MRNRALSVLRARQLIITMSHKQLIVLSWTLELRVSPRLRGAPENHFKRTGITEPATFPFSIVSVAVRNTRPASAIRILIRRVQHREPRTALLWFRMRGFTL